MNINHILVDMDPTSDQQPALDKAITLAKRFNASIELFLVVYNSGIKNQWFLDSEQLEKIKQSYIKSQQRWLDTYVNEVVNAQLSVSADVRWHKPIYEAIIDKVKESNADLVIKSTHQHPTLSKVFFNPNDWQLLKACPVPLLLAKQRTNDNYDHIMAAIDPTQSHGKPEGLNKIIMDTTKAWSESLSASAHVAHCYESLELQMWQNIGIDSSAYGIGSGLTAEEYQNYKEQLDSRQTERFEKMIEASGFSEENKHLESGTAVEMLPELVNRNNIDLLVMGTTYRTGLLGSTVEKILDNVNCDILAVKPDGFET